MFCRIVSSFPKLIIQYRELTWIFVVVPNILMLLIQNWLEVSWAFITFIFEKCCFKKQFFTFLQYTGCCSHQFCPHYTTYTVHQKIESNRQHPISISAFKLSEWRIHLFLIIHSIGYVTFNMKILHINGIFCTSQ